MTGFAIFILVLVLLVILLLMLSVKRVPQGWNYTVERFGRFTTTLTPGVRFLVPFVDSIGQKVNVQELVLDIPRQQITSKDNGIVTVDAVASYQVIDAAKAAYEVHDLVQGITNLSLTSIREVVGNRALDDVLAKRDEVNGTLLSVIGHAASAWGVRVLRVELKDVVPPQALAKTVAGR